MMRHFPFCSALLVLFAVTAVSASAQQVVKKDVAGVSTFAQLESTIACGGSTKPEAIREIRNMGFESVVNLRLATEEGAMVEEEGAAVRAAGAELRASAFNAQSPDPQLIDNFIAAVAEADQYARVCALRSGGRAAALWMIKRVKADGWTVDRALVEANALGLNDRFRPFAMNYLATHP